MRAHTISRAEMRRLVGVFAEAIGIPPADTFTQDEVVRMLREMEYDVRPGTVGEFIRKGYIAELPDMDSWTVEDVFAFVFALGFRRRWQANSGAHEASKTEARRAVDRGDLAFMGDLDETTLEDLLIHMAEADQRYVRESCYEAVRRKLATLGFVEE